MSAGSLWAQFMTQYRGAEVARGVMRDRAATQIDRDLAAVRYGRACDQMMDILGRMADQQLLVSIGTVLKERGV